MPVPHIAARNDTGTRAQGQREKARCPVNTWPRRSLRGFCSVKALAPETELLIVFQGLALVASLYRKRTLLVQTKGERELRFVRIVLLFRIFRIQAIVSRYSIFSLFQ